MMASHIQNFGKVTVLLTQSTLSAPRVALNSEPVFKPPSEGRWAGLGVAFRSGMVLFLQSLDPSYLSPSARHKTVNSPAFTLCSAEDIGFLQAFELAAKLVSPCAGLPEGVSSIMGRAISASATLRFARDQLAAMSDSTSAGEPSGRPDQNNDKGKTRIVQADERQLASKPAAATMGAAQLPKAAVALGAMSCLAIAEAQSVIEVADAETLAKIGRDPQYPLNAIYHQSADFDVKIIQKSIGNRTHPFTGQYDGFCHTLSNGEVCLFKKLGGGGIVSNLRFMKGFAGSSVSGEPSGIVACEVAKNAVVNNILAVKSSVLSVNPSGMSKAHVGIGGGKVSGTVSNIIAIECDASTWADHSYAGIGGGFVSGGRIENILAINSSVEVWAGGYSAAGIGAGLVEKGTVVNTTAVNCNITNIKSMAEVASWHTAFGVGAGGLIEGTITDTSAINCKVKAFFNYARWVNVKTAIGAGYVRGRESQVINTRAINCEVDADYSRYDFTRGFAGIGAGNVTDGRTDSICETKVINSTVNAQFAGIKGGRSAYICNTSVNAIKQADTVYDCIHSKNNFCQYAAPYVLTPDCSIRNPHLVDNLINQSFGESGFCSPPATSSLSAGALIGISVAAGLLLLAGGLGGQYLYRRYCHSGKPESGLNSNNHENQPLLA